LILKLGSILGEFQLYLTIKYQIKLHKKMLRKSERNDNGKIKNR